MKKTISYPISGGLNRTNLSGSNVNINVPAVITDVQAPQYYSLNLNNVDVGDRVEVVVTSLTAPLYPILTMGINVDEYYNNALESTVTINLNSANKDGYLFTDAREFTNFMSILRLMGYDVKAKDLNTGRYVVNWADNASGRFLYSDTNNRDMPLYQVKFIDITQRKNHWINIGSFVGEITLGYKMHEMRLNMYNGSKVLQMYGHPITLLQDSKYAEKAAEIRVFSSTLQILPLTKVTMQDFRLARYVLPNLSGIATTILPQDTQQLVEPIDQEPVNPPVIPEEAD